MTRGLLIPLAILVLPIAVLFSCSSGGGIGGTGATGVTVGPITKFGSIFVNDAELDISNATVDLRGAPGNPGDPNLGLKLGMLVMVRGEFSPDGLTGVAHSVQYEDNLEGPVDSVDVAGSRITVLGQTVSVNAATVLEGVSAFGDLLQGNMVEVSGLFDASGNIVATRIEFKAQDFSGIGELDIKGTISSLNPGAMTFAIGNLQVDYSSVEAEHFPSGGLSVGLFVAIKSNQAPSGGTVVASEVERNRPTPDAELTQAGSRSSDGLSPLMDAIPDGV